MDFVACCCILCDISFLLSFFVCLLFIVYFVLLYSCLLWFFFCLSVYFSYFILLCFLFLLCLLFVLLSNQQTNDDKHVVLFLWHIQAYWCIMLIVYLIVAYTKLRQLSTVLCPCCPIIYVQGFFFFFFNCCKGLLQCPLPSVLLPCSEWVISSPLAGKSPDLSVRNKQTKQPCEICLLIQEHC